jgi:hypothetical protein
VIKQANEKVARLDTSTPPPGVNPALSFATEPSVEETQVLLPLHAEAKNFFVENPMSLP